MSDAPIPRRTRLAAAAGLLGAATVTAVLLGAGPAPSALQLAGASSDDPPGDVSGNCDEAEHAADPACGGTPTTGATTSTTLATTTTSTTVGGGAVPADDIRSLDAAGAGTVIYAVEGGSLRLVTATPTSGWAVEVEQAAGREIELDFRAGTRRVQVNLEIEDGQVRERVRVRDDADDTDVRTENGAVEDHSRGDDATVEDHGGRGHDDGSREDDDHGGSSGHGSDDSQDDDHGGHGGDD
jgi:hypothetical protein